MSSTLIAEPQPDAAAAIDERPVKAGIKTGQRGEEAHPLSREAQETSLNWFTISFMGLFHAEAILAFFSLPGRRLRLRPCCGSSASAWGSALGITGC